MLTETSVSSRYCCRLPVDILVGAVALDVSDLNALVAHGERTRCKQVVCGLARVGSDSGLNLLRPGRKALALFKRGLGPAADCHECQQRNLGGAFKLSCGDYQRGLFGLKLRAGCGGGAYGRACVLVGACECSTRVCKTPTRSGHDRVLAVLCGRVLLTWARWVIRVYIVTCEPHFTRVCIQYGVRHA